jgi:hypothetical protein
MYKTRKRLIKKEGGYAMLFTVIIVSAISVITAGLSNIVYKQLVLSSLAKDSQMATVWADTANECSIFFEQVVAKRFLKQVDVPSTWECGGVEFNIDWGDTDSETYDEGSYEYLLNPKDEDGNPDPCFSFDVSSSREVNSSKKVTIESRGYNICDKSKIRTVERSYQITYTSMYGPQQN